MRVIVCLLYANKNIWLVMKYVQQDVESLGQEPVEIQHWWQRWDLAIRVNLLLHFRKFCYLQFSFRTPCQSIQTSLL